VHPAAFGLTEVGLHPDQDINQRRQPSTGNPDALDEHCRRAGGHVDVALAAVPVPPGRSIVNRSAGVQRLQNPVDHQVVPAETRVRPRHIVGVHDGRRPHRPAETPGQRRLATSTTAVHRDDPRTPDRRPSRFGQRSGEGGQRLDAPRTSRRLPRPEFHAPALPVQTRGHTRVSRFSGGPAR
jgi:hypothetical protein